MEDSVVFKSSGQRFYRHQFKIDKYIQTENDNFAAQLIKQMAETLGMLCDKLTIVKLKQFHTENVERLKSLDSQAVQLQQEIDDYIADAVSGKIDPLKLTFAANKVFKKEGNEIADVTGNIAEVFYQLADVNCRLWHEQEKVYEFEKVPIEQKDTVVKQLAILNLERNKCIDAINQQLAALCLTNKVS